MQKVPPLGLPTEIRVKQQYLNVPPGTTLRWNPDRGAFFWLGTKPFPAPTSFIWMHWGKAFVPINRGQEELCYV